MTTEQRRGPTSHTFRLLEDIAIVVCHAEQLSHAIARLCSAFPASTDSRAAASMSVFDDRTIMDYGDGAIELRVPAHERDLYQMFFAFVYTLSHRRQCLPLHSVVVSRDDQGLLILGGFGAGKTSLSIAFRQCGYKIHAGDHSICRVTGADLLCVQGTKRVLHDGVETLLDDAEVTQAVRIAKIVVVVGACQGGKVTEEPIGDEVTRARRLWPSVSWPYLSPMVGSDQLLLQAGATQELIAVTRLVASSGLPMVKVRGDLTAYSRLQMS